MSWLPAQVGASLSKDHSVWALLEMAQKLIPGSGLGVRECKGREGAYEGGSIFSLCLCVCVNDEFLAECLRISLFGESWAGRAYAGSSGRAVRTWHISVWVACVLGVCCVYFAPISSHGSLLFSSSSPLPLHF